MQDIHYQDDNDRNYYCMDFSTHDSFQTGDSISGIPIVKSHARGSSDTDLLIEDVSTSGSYVCMWISSGTPYTTYKIEVEANTTLGRRIEGDGYLKVGD